MASGLYICNVALITSHFDRPLPHVHGNRNIKILCIDNKHLS